MTVEKAIQFLHLKASE
ncbi:hypothetical protein A2U01_0079087, partial [Trifolium medium]|nr:hypothetical protein [Trifolium medium]